MYGMSRAEFTVYSYVVQGLSNKEVADKVFISEKTVKFHLTNIYKKLNVKSRTKMMAKNLNKPSINTPTTTT
jgi:DNA-binding CsgD family transcriptional regulator